ncbi:MAG: DUF11 domain-containing protein [Deinococcaceae bacterium]
MSKTRRIVSWVSMAYLCAMLGAGPTYAQVCAVPGKDGTQSSLSGIVNTYYPAPSGTTSVSVGALSIPVGTKNASGSSADVQAGDLLLVIQMQDASINYTNTDAYGDGLSGEPASGATSWATSGQYEYAIASGPVSGGSIPLRSALTKGYVSSPASSTQGQRRYQVIRVPQYSSAVLSGQITAPAWDGSSGGIVAMDVAGNLNMNGQTIDVSAKGFRGGGAHRSNSPSNGTGVAFVNVYNSTITSINEAAKGEGVAGTPRLVANSVTYATGTGFENIRTQNLGVDGYPGGDYARGAPANGGGGGTNHNAGGGGGGNGGSGGKGGLTYHGDFSRDQGGFGGAAFPASADRLALGGGGGSGETNNANDAISGSNGYINAADVTIAQTLGTSGGGYGGGIILLKVGSVSGSGNLLANGSNGLPAGRDAAGGGGAGGSVMVLAKNNSGFSGLTVQAKGGNGGNTNTINSSLEGEGPGGGGGGGFIISSGTIPSADVSGGQPGYDPWVSASATRSGFGINYGSLAATGRVAQTNLLPSDVPGTQGSAYCFPELTVSKSTSTPTRLLGQTATYTLTLSNAANKGTAQAVTLTDVLSPGLSFLSSTSVSLSGGATQTSATAPSLGATNLSWGTFSLPGGSSVTFSFNALVANNAALATYQNGLTATYTDPQNSASTLSSVYDPNTSTAEDVVVLGAPLVSKVFSPPVVIVGESSTQSITIRNPNSVTVTGISFVDTYPTNLTNASVPTTTCPGGTLGYTASTLTLSGANLPAGASCVVTVQVSSLLPSVYQNTTGSVTTTNAGTALPSVAFLAVERLAPPVLVKSFVPATVLPGQASVLTLTLSNPNAIDILGVSLSDTYPGGLVNASAPLAASTCPGAAVVAAASGNTLTLSGATIPAGSTCQVTVQVQAASAGIYNNTTSDVLSSNAGTGGASSNTLSVLAQPTVNKTFSSRYVASGASTTLSISIANPNTSALTLTSAFTDTFPAGLVVAGAPSGTCVGAVATLGSGSVVLPSGSVVPTGGCTVDVPVSATLSGDYTNTLAAGALVTTGGSNATSSTAVVTVLVSPSLSKAFYPTQIAQNGVSTLTLTLGNSNAIPIVLSSNFVDTLPSGLSITGSATHNCVGTLSATSGGSVVTLPTGSQIPAGGCSITVQVTGNTAGTYVNTLAAGALQTTAGQNASAAQATLMVLSPPTISKSFSPSAVKSGVNANLTITLGNPNSVPITLTSNMVDSLPSGLYIAAGTNSGTCSGTIVPYVGDQTQINITHPAGSTIPVGGCTIVISVGNKSVGTFVNTIPVGELTTNAGSNASVAQASLAVDVYKPMIAKSFSPSGVGTSVNSQMTVTLSNPTGITLTGVSFTDTYPSNLKNATPTGLNNTCGGTASATAGGTSLSLSGVTLTAGQTCTVQVNVLSTVSGNYTNMISNVASDQGTGAGTQAILSVATVQPLQIAKSFSPTHVFTGGVSTLTLTLTNPNSSSNMTNVAFTDTYPTNVVNAATPTLTNTCGGTASATGGGNSVSLSGGSLASASTCAVTVRVTSSTVGAYTNTTGSVSGQFSATTYTGNTASANLSVFSAPLTKSFSVTSIDPGQISRLTLNLPNPTAQAITLTGDFTDTLPTNVTVASVPNAASTCTGSVNTTSSLVRLLSGATVPSGGCTVSVDVTSTTAGSYTNTVAASAYTTSVGNGSSAATAVLTVNSLKVPRATKSFSPSSIDPNGTSQLSVVIYNDNLVALTGVAATDVLPSGLSASGSPGLSSSCGGTPTYTGGTRTLALSGGTIPASGTCTLTMNVTASTPGTYTNTLPIAAISSTNAGSSTQVTSANLTVRPLPPTLLKSFSPTSVAIGGTSRLTLTLSNPNTSLLTGIALSDVFPAQLKLAAVTNLTHTCGGSVSASDSGLVLSGGYLAASSACSIAVDVRSDTSGTITNTIPSGSLTTLESSPLMSDVSANLVVTPAVAPNVSKRFVSHSISIGEVTTLEITLTNPNAISLSGVALADTFPSHLVRASGATPSGTCVGTLSSTSGSLSLSGGTLAPYGTCTIQIDVTSVYSGLYTNTLPIGAVSSSNAPSSSAATSDVLLVGAQPPAVSKSFSPSTVLAGDNATLTITLTNPNGADLLGVGFTDTFPVDLSAVGTPVTTCGGTVAASGTPVQLVLSGASVAANGQCTVTLTVRSLVPGSYTNTLASGAVTTLNTPSNTVPASAILSVGTPQADLRVLKTSNVSVAAKGYPFAYTIQLTNLGPQNATGVSIKDTLPVAVGYLSSSATQGSFDLATSIWTVGSVPVGATVTLTMNVRVTADPPSQVVTNTAQVWTSGQLDPDVSNNSSSVDLVANPILLTKSVRNVTQGTAEATSSSGKPGDILEYCIDYANTSSIPLNNLTVRDTVPGQVDYLADSLKWRAGGVAVPFVSLSDGVDLDAGDVQGVSVRVRVGSVAASAQGRVCFRATIR